MQTTIRIRGREYQLGLTDPRPFEAERFPGKPVYVLTGKRGARYETTRNVPRPDLMFLMGVTSSFSKTMDGVWLTDTDGHLAVVTD